MDIISVLTHWLAGSIGAIIGVMALAIVKGGSND